MNTQTKFVQRQSGLGRLTLLVFGTIIAVVVYCGYCILPFYYCYFEITNQMEQVIKVASTYTDKEIREKLLYHIKKLELPVEPDDLRIERDAGTMRISLPYREIFYVTWKGKDYDIHTFEFHAYAEGHY
ncbi:MAG: hypothetical protein K1X79_13630 [Oligoflexia bacterium]|nr:hypothetical protein [Oligoflexia bacterium]